ncbi:MAG: lipopolysaccharide biosynthesis protein [Candidatus Eisenbacteria bacterium]|uniref:Lipopolysaccharide biosynthesis protein n=1 Tax=Eiseniibacteriota bacterium TaxID=2212470 RepID=A0A849SC63_UNCEI|nr:lipopolysaccharide biosynthesis protein [Candidatus Eisenbacteria bacterium]
MKPGEIAHSVTRGAFYLAIEKLVALVSGILYFALLLRWLGPTKYGIMTLALSFAGLATMVNGNAEVYLERFAAEYQTNDRLGSLRRAHLLALFLKSVLGAFAALLLVLLAPWLARHFEMPELAVLLPPLAALVLADGCATTARATLFGLQQFRWVSGLAIVFHVAKTVMVGSLWWMRQGLEGLAVGLAVLSVVQALGASLVPLALLAGKRDHDGAVPGIRELWRSMIGYCAPLLGARATFMSGQNLGKVVLGKLFDAESLGYFSFAFQTVERFVEVIYVLPSSLLPSLTKLVARQERERLRWIFDQAFRLIQITAVVLALGLWLFAHEVTLFVGSPLFEKAVPLLRILCLVPIARTAQQPLTMLFQAMRKPGTVLWLALLKFGIEFGCYFTLIPLVGLAGAGWANLLGAVAAYLAALAATRRLLPEGASDRQQAMMRSAGLVFATLALGLVVQLAIPGWPGLGVRIVLFVALLPAAFALGLVTRYDLDKLASVPVRPAWLHRLRGEAVGAAHRMALALEPRSSR